MENNWKHKSLESLEKDIWTANENVSRLTGEIMRLRKVPLSEFSIENMRILIGQNIGLKHLIPLAIDELSNNLFAEGDLYEGDLLQVVLKIPPTFWLEHKKYWIEVHEIIKNRLQELKENRIDVLYFKSIVF